MAPFRQFASPIHIITCSLGGKVTCLRMSADAEHSSRILDEIWTFDTSSILKVNSMKFGSTPEDGHCIVIGGLDRAGRGIAEIYQPPLLPSWCVIQYLRSLPSFDGHLPAQMLQFIPLMVTLPVHVLAMCQKKPLSHFGGLPNTD